MSKDIQEQLQIMVDNGKNVLQKLKVIYATKEETNLISSMLPNFKIYRLYPGEKFELEPNMLCFLHGEGLNCVNYCGVKENNESVTKTGLDAAAFLSSNIDKLSDPKLKSEFYNKCYRVFCIQGSKSAFGIPEVDFGGLRLLKGAYLENTYTLPEGFDYSSATTEADANKGSVLIYYIKQGKHAVENTVENTNETV